MSLSKRCIFAFLSVYIVLSSLQADPPSLAIKDPAALINTELGRLDTLIQATQQSLDGQKKLKEKIIEYKKIQEQYLQKPTDNDLLLRLVKSAHRTLELIKETHLGQTFDPEFINELTVFSQPINKRGIPKP